MDIVLSHEQEVTESVVRIWRAAIFRNVSLSIAESRVFKVDDGDLFNLFHESSHISISVSTNHGSGRSSM